MAVAMSVLVCSFLALPLVSLALTNTQLGLDNAGKIGLGQADLKDTINSVVGVLLGFLGILAVLLIMYGGFMWMTAAGDETKVEKAKHIIMSGIIGIVIILAAYAIAQFVITNIRTATGG